MTQKKNLQIFVFLTVLSNFRRSTGAADSTNRFLMKNYTRPGIERCDYRPGGGQQRFSAAFW
jgi:hypothetical protein